MEHLLLELIHPSIFQTKEIVKDNYLNILHQLLQQHKQLKQLHTIESKQVCMIYPIIIRNSNLKEVKQPKYQNSCQMQQLQIIGEEMKLKKKELLKNQQIIKEEEDLLSSQKTESQNLMKAKKDQKICIIQSVKEFYLNLEEEGNWQGQMCESAILSLLGGQKVYLGGVPGELVRLKLASTLDLSHLKNMMSEVLQFSKESGLKNEILLGSVTKQIFSHCYSYIGDYYTYNLLLLLAAQEKSQGLTLFIKGPQVERIKLFLLNNESSSKNSNSIINQKPISLNDFNFIQPTNETDEILIEKHAILEVLFGDKIWTKSYIKNPFPYLQQVDYNTLGAQDKQNILKAYQVQVRKYAAAANRFLQQ